jgi:hypothetical protein
MIRHRRDIRKEARRVPLVLLAGLPHPISGAVASVVEKTLVPSPKVIHQASGSDNKELYKPQTVAGLLRAVSDYAVRQLRAQTSPPIPTQILLAYVPAGDEERLLGEFDFFVFPVRLTRLAEYEHGRQYRHDRKICEEYVGPAVETALMNFMEVKRRLSSPNLREPLFLPPRNFKVTNSDRMADIFLGLRRAKTPWGGPLPNIRTTKVTHDDLKKHVPVGKHKEVLCDHRNLLFPHDQSNHGPARELAQGCSEEDRKQFMRSSFRFGVPLIDGYHHDVQYPRRDLGGEQFECSREGIVSLTSAYANVYPNDFVRPSKK